MVQHPAELPHNPVPLQGAHLPRTLLEEHAYLRPAAAPHPLPSPQYTNGVNVNVSSQCSSLPYRGKEQKGRAGYSQLSLRYGLLCWQIVASLQKQVPMLCPLTVFVYFCDIYIMLTWLA